MSTRVAVSSTLADSLSRGEVSARAEGVDVTADPAYQLVKRKMLDGEINSDEAIALYLETRGL